MNTARYSVTDHDRRQLVRLLGVAALAVIALLGYLISSGYREAKHTAELTTRDYAELLNLRLSSTLRDADTELRRVQRTMPVAALGWSSALRYRAEWDAEFDQFLKDFPNLSSLRVFDARGDLLYTSDRPHISTINIADRPYFQQARDGIADEPVFSDVIVARATGRNIVTISRPLRDAQGTFHGIVVAAINFNYFLHLFETLNTGAHGNIVIYRSDKFTQILRWPPAAERTNVALGPDSPTRAALAGGEKTVTMEITSVVDHVARIYSHRVLDNYPFFVTVGISRADALAGWKLRSLGVSAGGLLLLALLARMVYRLRDAESELKERDAWFGAAFEQAAVGMALRDIDPRNPHWLRVNKKLCDILGYTREELREITPLDVTRPEDRDAAHEYHTRLVRGEVRLYSREKRYTRKDGNSIWVNLSSAAIDGPDGRPGHILSVIEDITERKNAETALRNSEEKFSKIFQLTPTFIAISTLGEGLYLDVNIAFERTTGFRRDEVVGRTAIEIGLWVDAAERARLVERLASERRVSSMEVQLRRKSGEIMNCEISVEALDIGGVPCMLSITSDVTERKRGEEANALLAAIVKASNDAIISRTLTGRTITSWNAAAERMFGYTAEEALGQSGELLIPPEREQESLRNRESLAQGNPVIDLETVRVAKDGKRIDVSMNQSPIFDAQGTMTSVAIIFRDISARKRANEELLASTRKLEAALGSMTDAVFISDVTGRFIEINDAFATFHRFSNKAECAKTFAEYPDILEVRSAAGELLPVEQWAVPRALRGETASNAEYQLRRKDTGATWIGNYSFAPIRDKHGAIVGSVVTGRDVTEIKQAESAREALEAQLRESQKMEAIGTLAGGVAHDFNNIIATIIGNAELALSDTHAHPATVDSIAEIRKAASRARDLVQQILSFSRRQPTARKPASLAQIIEESARLLRATLPARIVIETVCAPDLPQIMADATQIQQVVLNLATNAMQAMRGNPGLIRMQVDSVMLDAKLARAQPELRAMLDRRPGRTVRLAVSDNGPGMDAATRARIFEPFFTTKPTNEGTGLGLAVVHGIVQTHEGAITVHSEPGSGATFTLYLPEAAAAPADAAPARDATGKKSAPVTGGGQHILYIDDEEPLIFITRRLLERRGFRLSGHTDARAALDVLRNDPGGFDLVVTDYNMPAMSGLDVAREVRAIRPDLPLAVASGFIDEELQAQAASAGVRELIFKANSVEDLCDAITRLANAAPPRTPHT